MLRLLLFVEPKPLSEHLFRNSSWLNFPLNILQRLAESDPTSFELHAAIPNRFLHCLSKHASFLENRIYPLNEAAIVQTIHQHGWTIRQTWNAEFLNTTNELLKKDIENQIVDALPTHPWDIILTFGEECRYRIAQGAMCMNLESSPFGRFPFKPSVFIDHLGLFRNSATARFFGGHSEPPEITQTRDNISENVRDIAIQVIASTNILNFKREFERYILLPLQASNYSSFDAQCDERYDTQLDYLFDICNQISQKTGVVVTEHPQAGSIANDNNFPMIVQGLRDLFSNVSYLPRAKYFPSSSLTLLNEVDGVWTHASNVGPVASFLGRPVGTPADSHIAYAASANSIAELEELIDPPDAGKSDEFDAVFDWIFKRYLVPVHKIDEPDWIANYIKQRYQSFKMHGRTIESFTPTNLEPVDFVDPAACENGPPGKKSFHYNTMINQKIHLFRYQEMIRLRKSHAVGRDRSFVLLNNTAELESYRHLGCNHVFVAIQKGMADCGFRFLYSQNGSEEIKLNRPLPDWVVINGEGSFHHNSCRAKDLMQIAVDFKSRGSKIALVNSIWEKNDECHAQPLKQFDLVAVRDGSSQRELHSIGIPAILTPDYSIGQWIPDSHPYRRCQLMFTDNIVYNRARKMFDAALHLDGEFYLLDHRQVEQFDSDGCFAAVPSLRLSPNLLTHNCQVADAEMVVAGRFHVVLARVALGKPFVFVESNTNKISHLLIDIGIPPESLNVTEEVENCDWQLLKQRIARAKSNFDQYSALLKRYREAGIATIQDVFSLIKNRYLLEPTDAA